MQKKNWENFKIANFRIGKFSRAEKCKKVNLATLYQEVI
jgi:hypothetical protein